jgi:ATP phosphoribosyltransferase regulatory subunit
LNLEDLHQTLLPTGQLPQQTPRSDWLVVATRPQADAAAFTHAQRLRRAAIPEERVELYLHHAEDDAAQSDVNLDVNLDAHSETVRQYARDRDVAQIAWVQPDGKVEVESVTSSQL